MNFQTKKVECEKLKLNVISKVYKVSKNNQKINYNENIDYSNEIDKYDINNNSYETKKNNVKSLVGSPYLSSVAFNEKLKTLKKYSKEYYDTYLEYRISQAGGYGTRDASVATARYLSEEYKINDKNLPYFWGGKRLDKGIDENWGNLKTIAGSGTNDQPLGEKFPYGLDCSGFVSWVLYNSGYDINVYYSDGIVNHCLKKGGINHQLSKDIFNTEVFKPGDILYRDNGNDDHIAIITGYDEENKIIKFAEENGSKGLVSNELSFDDFMDKYNNIFTGIISMDDYYSNPNNLRK